ncbi:MAG: hypothetical protein Q8O67_00735 [Deltaproteobacteria bacterium]|nr:hypothetical protein [Deltaproteobacteria bacterium]
MSTEVNAAPAPASAPDRRPDDSGGESAIVGGAVALAIVVGLGFGALKLGLLDDLLGGPDPLTTAAPIVTAIHTLSGGDPERILISGSVVDVKEGPAIEARLRALFPGSELKNATRLLADPKEKPGVKKPPPMKKSSTIRLSFAADAPNEAWPRPRFGDVKRLELLWKDGKITVRGAVFSPTAKATLDKAFAALPKEAQASAQIREVQRPVVPAAELQQTVSVAAGGRTIPFAKGAAADSVEVDLNDPVVAAVAAVLTDLRGLEVWISAGADDRGVSLKQAEAVKAALIAKGADAAGLRPVPAAKNNALSFIVREKESP